MRIALLGAGSLGMVLGAFITKAGYQIDLIDANPAHVAAMNANGAKVIGSVDVTVPVHALTPDQVEGEYDIVLYLAKQTYNESALTGILPHLAKDAVVCTMQNGLPEMEVGQYVGMERVMGCPVGWAAILVEPGICRLTSPKENMSFELGWPDGHTDDRLMEVKKLLECLCPTVLLDNLLGVRWAKLLTNATFSGLSTTLGCTFGEVVLDERSLYCAQQLANECIHVCQASGVTMGSIQGYSMADMYGFSSEAEREAKKAVYQHSQKGSTITASMLFDLKKGIKTEVDAINGVVVAYGKKFGVATPFNEKVVEIIKKAEAEKSVPTFDNIEYYASLLPHC